MGHCYSSGDQIYQKIDSLIVKKVKGNQNSQINLSQNSQISEYSLIIKKDKQYNILEKYKGNFVKIFATNIKQSVKIIGTGIIIKSFPQKLIVLTCLHNIYEVKNIQDSNKSDAFVSKQLKLRNFVMLRQNNNGKVIQYKTKNITPLNFNQKNFNQYSSQKKVKLSSIDFGLFIIKKKQSQDKQLLDIQLNDSPIQKNPFIKIFGFSTVSQIKKHLKQKNLNLQGSVGNKASIQKRSAQINEQEISYEQLVYQINTEPGFSGSPLLYKEKNNTLSILGIHTRTDGKANMGVKLDKDITRWISKMVDKIKNKKQIQEQQYQQQQQMNQQDIKRLQYDTKVSYQIVKNEEQVQNELDKQLNKYIQADEIEDVQIPKDFIEYLKQKNILKKLLKNLPEAKIIEQLKQFNQQILLTLLLSYICHQGNNRVRVLKANNKKLTAKIIQTIKKFIQLENIDLAINSLTNKDLSDLLAMNSLANINLRHNKINFDILRIIIDSKLEFKNLRSLILGDLIKTKSVYKNQNTAKQDDKQTQYIMIRLKNKLINLQVLQIGYKPKGQRRLHLIRCTQQIKTEIENDKKQFKEYQNYYIKIKNEINKIKQRQQEQVIVYEQETRTFNQKKYFMIQCLIKNIEYVEDLNYENDIIITIKKEEMNKIQKILDQEEQMENLNNQKETLSKKLRFLKNQIKQLQDDKEEKKQRIFEQGILTCRICLKYNPCIR